MDKLKASLVADTVFSPLTLLFGGAEGAGSGDELQEEKHHLEPKVEQQRRFRRTEADLNAGEAPGRAPPPQPPPIHEEEHRQAEDGGADQDPAEYEDSN